MDRVDLQGGQRNNAYIYRDPQKGGKWHLYFLNRESNKHHRFVLKRSDGRYPDALEAEENEALGLAQKRYIDLRSRTDRGEAVKFLTLGEWCVGSSIERSGKSATDLPRASPLHDSI